jgi:dTDP-glucose 4,6-dehydratase
MRLLITGGAGFIGSAVVRHVLRQGGCSVLNVDKLTYASNLDNLSEVLPNPNYNFLKADISDAAAMRKAFAEFQPDAVLHLAAETHVDRSIDEPGAFIATNVTGTYVMLEAARNYWNGLPESARGTFRFLHISTDEVFGSLGGEGKFTETTPYAPNSPYAASKASSDMLVRAWHRTFGLPAIISNCSNNYGPYQFPEKLLPTVTLAALEGRVIPVYGDGQNVRDWLYVGDHAAALMRILEAGRAGETYNIGGNSEKANIDLIRMVCGLLDDIVPSSAQCPHEKLITFVKDRPGHDHRYAIDAGKIESELGWKPSVSLEEGLRQTVSWYVENGGWVDALRQRGFRPDRLGNLPG